MSMTVKSLFSVSGNQTIILKTGKNIQDGSNQQLQKKTRVECGSLSPSGKLGWREVGQNTQALRELFGVFLRYMCCFDKNKH